jgi:hypothetical protein
MKKCSVENCNNNVWGKRFCKNHIPKTPLQKSTLKKTYKPKEKEKINKRNEQVEKRHLLFLEIWDEREEVDSVGNKFVRCFETNKRMGRSFYRENSCCYHHCLYKNKYPQYDLVKENIVVCLPEIHASTHLDIDKTPKIKNYTNFLLNKFTNLEIL